MPEATSSREVPYRDAWDQKPPGVHFTYAAMLALCRDESMVATTDLVVAAMLMIGVIGLGARRTNATRNRLAQDCT